jgi:transposase-like protein
VIEEGKAVIQTARQLDISPKTLHKWVADYKKDAEHSFVWRKLVPHSFQIHFRETLPHYITQNS